MIKIVVCGAAGRMGKRILDCALADKEFKIVGAIEHPSSPLLGKDAGECAGVGALGVPLSSDLRECLSRSDVAIDFSQPEATLQHLEVASQMKKPFVVGTTGFSDVERREIEKAATRTPVLLSPNMSVGVNVLLEVVGEVAKKLGADYDIEIVEAHHRFKKDAPSGTAKKLAEVIAQATGRVLAKEAVYGRQGAACERKKGEIGIHAVRAGDIVGDHTVTFCALGERVEITHRAHSRDTFAKGALRAASFLAEKKPGLYSMREVLSENTF